MGRVAVSGLESRPRSAEPIDDATLESGTGEPLLSVSKREEYPYACERCGKSFAAKARLQRHVTTVHLKQRDHTCEYCGKSFYFKYHVQAHVEAVHLMTSGARSTSILVSSHGFRLLWTTDDSTKATENSTS
ncbi:unnamed protein product [Dicrocoelium dendriticum]|nr:unnamed protein product [Dicrocoelium dendriticum]